MLLQDGDLFRRKPIDDSIYGVIYSTPIVSLANLGFERAAIRIGHCQGDFDDRVYRILLAGEGDVRDFGFDRGDGCLNLFVGGAPCGRCY